MRNSLGASDNEFWASISVASLPKGKPENLFDFWAPQGSASFPSGKWRFQSSILKSILKSGINHTQLTFSLNSSPINLMFPNVRRLTRVSSS